MNCVNSYVTNALRFGHDFDIFLVEDSVLAKKEFLINGLNDLPFKSFYYTHEDIAKELEENAWIFPKNSGACRGFGFLKAYKGDYDVLLTVDDDVFAIQNEDFVGLHLSALELKGDGQWYNPFSNIEGLEDIYSRGFPYNSRKEFSVILNQGTQLIGPDVDSITLQAYNIKDGIFPFHGSKLFKPNWIIVPKGVYTTVSYTSVAIKSFAIPAYYTQLMGEELNGLKINRFDDIWSGLFLKKVADYLGYSVSHGPPISEHRRVTRSLEENLSSEKRGIEIAEYLWKIVDRINLCGTSFLESYNDLAYKLENKVSEMPYPEYIQKNCKAMKTWCELLETK
jgi:hypothetical protein